MIGENRMRVAYLDCFSGISGDMMLGALLDCGFSESELRQGLARLPVHGYRVEVSRQKRAGFEGTRVEVIVDRGHQPHRDYGQIRALVQGAALPERVRDLAGRIFLRIAEAESKVHGVTPDHVHFHEVGAVDSIVDVVGVALGVEALGIEKVFVSDLPLGSGSVRCAHGVLPVPAPATAEILKGMRVRKDHPVEGELVTPTGAAIAAVLSEGASGSPSSMRIERVGYGAGSREDRAYPNLLRLWIGQTISGWEQDDVRVLECQIDDLSPEIYPYLVERLLEAGALDVVLVPVQMKKGRPGMLVQVISGPVVDQRLLEVLFSETTTLGVRIHGAERVKLRRWAEHLETGLGTVAVKACEGPGLKGVEFRPEHEECRRLAREKGVPLRAVYEEILWAALSRKRAK